MEEKIFKTDTLRLSNEESNKITRESLLTAMLLLMNEKPFEKITITELVRKAGVSRMAFYRNYDSKEDILISLKDGINEILKNAFLDLEKGRGGYDVYHKIFKGIAEQAEALTLLLKTNYAFPSVLQDNHFFDELVPVSDNTRYYKLVSCFGAVMSVVIQWFVRGMKESVEFMADYCAKNIGSY